MDQEVTTKTTVRPKVGEEGAARVFLQPIAAPSILGLFGFSVATMMVSTNMAGWYGSEQSPFFLFPFVALFGGLAQFMASIWSFRARDGLAVAIHGLWGSFWMAYGLLYGMAAAKWIAIPVGFFPEMGFWFIGLAWVTWIAVVAATAVSWSLTIMLVLLAAGSTIAAVAHLNQGAQNWMNVAGWVLFFSSLASWYTASALMLESVFGRDMLPVGKPEPSERAERPDQVTVGFGEPGVIHGQ